MSTRWQRVLIIAALCATVTMGFGGAAVTAAPMSGMTDTKAAGLRVTLDTLLQEHAYLAAMATGAALGGRQADFKAAAGALDQNSIALSKAIGSVYGAGAEQAFLPLWRKHIGFIVDYTVGLAAKNKMQQDKAVSDLIGYTKDFGAFLHSANPSLPADAVAELVKQHVLTLKVVIDEQAAGHPMAASQALRAAAAHMQMIGDTLAAAIVTQFPDKFAQIP